MPTPGEHKTVHPPSLKLRRTGARILEFSQEAGWTFVPRPEAERRRGLTERGLCFAISASHPSSLRHQLVKGDRFRAKPHSHVPPPCLMTCSTPMCESSIRVIGRRRGRCQGSFRLRQGYGGTCRNFVEYPRDRDKFFDHEEKREHDPNLRTGN